MARVIKAGEAVSAGHVPAASRLRDLEGEARAVVLEARKDAARILAQTQTAVETAERRAAEKGYSDGFAKGRAEGLDQGRREGDEQARRELQSELAAMVGAAGDAVAGLRAVRDELLEAGRESLLELAIELARKVASRVAVADSETARANRVKAMERLVGAAEIVVNVHPSQVDDLRGLCGELAEQLNAGPVRLVGDRSVEPGGARVVTRAGQIDATIRSQLDAVAEALLGRPPDRPRNGRYVSRRRSAEKQAVEVSSSHESV